MEFLGSKSALASPHHPQTDGQSERTVQSLLTLIRAFASEQQNLWEELTPMFQFSLNDSFCESTRNTPFRVLYGNDPISPMRLINRQTNVLDWDQPVSPMRWEEKTAEQLAKVWDFIRRQQQAVAQRMKERYDRNRQPLNFADGDLVLLSTKSHQLLEGRRKQNQRYVGPYVIESKVNENAYKLSGLPPGVPTTQNGSYLKLFRPNPRKYRTRPTPSANVPSIINNEFEWEVEQILNDRGSRDNYSFLVKWAHTPQRQWLPLRCLTHCTELLRDYYRRYHTPIPEYVLAHIEQAELEHTTTTTSQEEEEEQRTARMQQDPPRHTLSDTSDEEEDRTPANRPVQRDQ